jgi:hypothetical protein
MKALGYEVHMPKDESVLGIITEMENQMPLCRVSIDEFERRIKKLCTVGDASKDITLNQMIAVLKDHPLLGEDI